MTIQNTNKKRAVIQSKLKIGQPNDRYEQEADAVADQVMKMPASQIEPIQRKCDACEEEELQMKSLTPTITPIVQKKEEEEELLQMKGTSNETLATNDLESSLQQSKGSGQSMDSSTQLQMSEGIGADFSKVKVHTDSSAIQMNQQLNAKAFTNGSDVYFNQGQYNPQSSQGKHLLAHELTHVVQQVGSAKKTLQKKPLNLDTSTAETHESIGHDYSQDTGIPYQEGIQYTEGYEQWMRANSPSANWLPLAEELANPLERLKQNKPSAKTFFVINGVEIDGTNMTIQIQNILDTITPTAIKSKPIDGGQIKCSFDPVFKLNAGAKIIVPTVPSKTGWKAKLPPSALNNPPSCMGKTDIPTILEGKPDHASYRKLIRDSELEHVTAVKELYERHIVPFYQFAMGLTVTGASEADCTAKLQQQLGKRPNQAALGFALGDAADTKRFDDPSSTHHGTMTIVDLGTNCNRVTMEASQNNPQQPGNSPGNVQLIPPVVQTVNPAKLTNNGNDLLSDGTVISTFSSPSNALEAMGMMMVHQITEIRTIGPFQIALSNGSAPIQKMNGIQEKSFDPSLIQVSIGFPNAADWVISQILGDAFIEITNFGAGRDEAYSAVELLRQFGFTHKVWIGSESSPELSYFLKR